MDKQASFPTQALDVPHGDPEFRVTDVPLALFAELSAKLGFGDEFKGAVGGHPYRLRRLDPAHPLAGFEGVIGMREHSEHETHAMFKLWDRPPTGYDADDVFNPDPLVEVIAGPQDGGMWAYGRGNLIAERVFARTTRTIRLDHPSTVLVGMILVRASMIVRDPRCRADKYWQADRFPGRYEE